MTGGKTWKEHSLSYEHNKRVNATLQVGAQVNDTHCKTARTGRGLSKCTDALLPAGDCQGQLVGAIASVRPTPA